MERALAWASDRECHEVRMLLFPPHRCREGVSAELQRALGQVWLREFIDALPRIGAVFHCSPDEPVPIAIERLEGPSGCFALRCHPSFAESEEQPAERDHEVGLFPSTHWAGLGRSSRRLGVLVNTSGGFALQVWSGDWIDQSTRFRPGKRQPVFTQEPPNHGRVAVTIEDELIGSVVEVKERRARPVHSA